MDYSNIITPTIMMLVMAFLFAVSKKKPKEDEKGNKILRLPLLYPIMGGTATLGSVIILGYGLFTCKSDEVIFVFLFFLMAAGLGVPLLLMGTIFKIVITPEQIEQTTAFGKIKTIRWSDITSISFGKISLELKIKSHNQTIKVHMHLVGFPYFINEIEANTKFTRADMGLPKF